MSAKTAERMLTVSIGVTLGILLALKTVIFS